MLLYGKNTNCPNGSSSKSFTWKYSVWRILFNRTCYYNLLLVDVILAVCRRIVEADLWEEWRSRCSWGPAGARRSSSGWWRWSCRPWRSTRARRTSSGWWRWSCRPWRSTRARRTSSGWSGSPGRRCWERERDLRCRWDRDRPVQSICWTCYLSRGFLHVTDFCPKLD